jgi:hypothetical protein
LPEEPRARPIPAINQTDTDDRTPIPQDEGLDALLDPSVPGRESGILTGKKEKRHLILTGPDHQFLGGRYLPLRRDGLFRSVIRQMNDAPDGHGRPFGKGMTEVIGDVQDVPSMRGTAG